MKPTLVLNAWDDVELVNPQAGWQPRNLDFQNSRSIRPIDIFHGIRYVQVQHILLRAELYNTILSICAVFGAGMNCITTVSLWLYWANEIIRIRTSRSLTASLPIALTISMSLKER
jgi:hypothetical protein